MMRATDFEQGNARPKGRKGNVKKLPLGDRHDKRIPPGFPMTVVVVRSDERDRCFDTPFSVLRVSGVQTLVVEDPMKLPTILPGYSWLRGTKDDATTLYRQM